MPFASPTQVDEYSIPPAVAVQLAGLQAQVIHGDFDAAKANRCDLLWYTFNTRTSVLITIIGFCLWCSDIWTLHSSLPYIFTLHCATLDQGIGIRAIQS